MIIQFTDEGSWFNQIINDEHYSYILNASSSLLLVNSRTKRLFDDMLMIDPDAKNPGCIEQMLSMLNHSIKPSRISIASSQLNVVAPEEDIKVELVTIATAFHIINSYYEKEVLKLISSLESDVLVISGGESSIPLERIIQKVLSKSDCSILVMRQ